MRTVRRRFLICLPAALAPSGALGFRLEEPGAEMASDYLAACPATHEALRREMEGGPRPPAPAPELVRCPYCGCGVSGAPDHGEGARPR